MTIQSAAAIGGKFSYGEHADKNSSTASGKCIENGSIGWTLLKKLVIKSS
jgi:hypothetical protein